MFQVFYLLQFLNGCIIYYYVTGKLRQIIGKCLLMSLNKWNQREIYSEILMVDFHVTFQNYGLFFETNEKIIQMTLGLFMAHYDPT
jgi:hypothetical protein